MIYIKEEKSKKMTGITSLFLYTENLEILDKLAEAIKYYCPVNHFNKNPFPDQIQHIPGTIYINKREPTYVSSLFIF